MRKLFVAFALMLLFSSGLVSAASYVNGRIDVDSSGFVEFRGDKNVDLGFEGASSELTSKDGGVWSFELNSEDVVDDILLDVCFSDRLEKLITVESDLLYSIDLNGRVCVEFIDGGRKMDIKIDYGLEENSVSYIALIVITILLLAALVLIVYSFRKKKDKFSDIESLINENEKKILDELMKGNVRQKELRRRLDMPKASFSRYVHNLEKKKLIIREGEGKNKVVKLK